MPEKKLQILYLHNNTKLLLCCLLILLATNCTQKYDSPVHSPATGYLVIDGVVNSMPGGTASLTLSRTTKLDSTNIVYETGAAVTIQGTDSSVYTLNEQGQGVYSAGNLVFNASLKYRLRITVNGGEEYISDFVVVKNNPPIDSISWVRQNDGVQLYINTHDPQNNTRYYQWNYNETWEFHSTYLSYLKYYLVQHDNVEDYHVGYTDSTTFSYDHTITTCWQFYNPTYIFLGSTASLSKDVVSLPLVFIPNASIKLGVLYSIHLTQYAWTEDGYNFLEKMKKNTEELGSVFDAQPSELTGNIHSVSNPGETVIGYFNICPVQEERIFIKNSDVPGWNYSAGCTDVVISNDTKDILPFAQGTKPTTIQTTGPAGGILTFRAATFECVDCTLTGTNKKPAYWP